MKQFSSEPYYVVGFDSWYGKYHETRFATARGAKRHAKRLVGESNRSVFIDRVGVMGVHTHHREEEGTNRKPWLVIDAQKRVWVWNGLHTWEHQTML